MSGDQKPGYTTPSSHHLAYLRGALASLHRQQSDNYYDEHDRLEQVV